MDMRESDTDREWWCKCSEMGYDMETTMLLINRNIKVYMRDKAAVFFSLLSMLITLALMVLFLGSMNSDTIVNLLAEYGGVRDALRDQANARHLVQVWTLAGIVLINCVTVTMTVMGNLVQDEEEGRLASFYIAPVGRVRITLGYILSAWFIGAGMSLFTLMLGNIVLVMDGAGLSLKTCLILTGMILVNSFFYASSAYLLSLFVHSQSAWSAVLSIIGTLVGFLGAVYLPMTMLPEKVGTVLKALPVLHGAAMMRRVSVQETLADTFAGLPVQVAEGYCEGMGITVSVKGEILSVTAQIVFVVFLSIVIAAAAALISIRRSVRER